MKVFKLLIEFPIEQSQPFDSVRILALVALQSKENIAHLLQDDFLEDGHLLEHYDFGLEVSVEAEGVGMKEFPVGDGFGDFGLEVGHAALEVSFEEVELELNNMLLRGCIRLVSSRTRSIALVV
jgi:hypothetical protein